MENHRHAKTHKKQHKYTQYCNNSFIKSYKKVVDKSGRLRYYKYVHKGSTDLTKGDGWQTVALFLFSLFYHIRLHLSTLAGLTAYFQPQKVIKL